MKFDEPLSAYLYEYKSLTLEGIGTFTLDEKVRVPGEHEKEVYYPIEGLAFTYNPKTGTDDNVIFFLVRRLGKIEPLIRSDLESYLYQIKVFLNIGNPYTIEGIGTLIKNNHGAYEFTPGNFLPAKEELYPKRENAAHNYPVRSTFSAGKFFVTILIVVAALAALGGIGWGVYNFTSTQFASNEEDRPEEQMQPVVTQNDTITLQKDSAGIVENIVPVSSPVPTADTSNSATYKMIFEVTKSKERAHNRTAQLNSLNSFTEYDSIPINDSVAYYRLYLIMKVLATDTARVKDSLQTFLGKKIYMVKHNE